MVLFQLESAGDAQLIGWHQGDLEGRAHGEIAAARLDLEYPAEPGGILEREAIVAHLIEAGPAGSAGLDLPPRGRGKQRGMYVDDRLRCGQRSMSLSDFLIGAHALLEAKALLRRDGRR